jgi:uncharacterized protein (UPF0147 family)
VAWKDVSGKVDASMAGIQFNSQQLKAMIVAIDPLAAAAITKRARRVAEKSMKALERQLDSGKLDADTLVKILTAMSALEKSFAVTGKNLRERLEDKEILEQISDKLEEAEEFLLEAKRRTNQGVLTYVEAESTPATRPDLPPVQEHQGPGTPEDGDGGASGV